MDTKILNKIWVKWRIKTEDEEKDIQNTEKNNKKGDKISEKKIVLSTFR